MENMNNGRILGWDEVINDTNERKFIKLEKGDYAFTVKDFKRTTYKGSAKIPPCPCAEVLLAVATPDGEAEVKYTMPLYSTVQFKIGQFLSAVGLRRHGEPISMGAFANVVGAHGCGAFYPRPWTGNDGKEKFSNEVDELYDYSETRLHELMVKAAPRPVQVEAPADMPWDKPF